MSAKNSIRVCVQLLIFPKGSPAHQLVAQIYTSNCTTDFGLDLFHPLSPSNYISAGFNMLLL